MKGSRLSKPGFCSAAEQSARPDELRIRGKIWTSGQTSGDAVPAT